jgi:predicted ABC-type ATPase
MSKSETPIMIGIGGPVGSGKSFISRNFKIRIDDFVYVNTDKIVQEMFGINPTKEQYEIGAKEADRIRSEALLNRRNLIIFESPFSNPYKIDYLAQGRNEGYFERVYYVGTENSEINVTRNEERREKEHRGPSPEYVRASWRDANANFPVAATVAQEAIVFDNSIKDRPQGTPLFRIQNGIIVCQYSEPPRWGQRIIEQLGTSPDYKHPPLELKNENLFIISPEMVRLPITPTPEHISQLLGERKTRIETLWRFREATGTMKERYQKALQIGPR